MKRRDFLHVIGAAGAATASGCARGGGPDNVIPYLIPADDGVLPGVNVQYATVCRECPAGCGMVAISRDGRVHKVEGNPDHPVNRGKLCLRGQASLQGLYNPDRIPQPLARDRFGRLQPISWDAAERRFDEAIHRASSGRAAWIGRLETGAMDRLTDEWLGAVAPAHTRLVYETFGYEPLREAARRVFGAAAVPEFRIDRADMLLSFGADFLETWISNVEYTRQYSAWRQGRVDGRHRGRYVFIGPRLSLSGQNADEWVSIRPGAESHAAAAILAAAQAAKSGTAAPDVGALCQAAGIEPQTVDRLAREFAAAASPLAFPPGNGVYGTDAAAAHESSLRLNLLAGGVGKTVIPNWPHALSRTSTRRELDSLLDEMNRGLISVLFLHHVNPAYDIPDGLQEAIRRVPAVVSFTSYPDETTGAPGKQGGFATLVLPDSTPLESWGEYAPRPGIDGILQPVVAPVFDTRPTGDVLISAASRMGRPMGAATFEEYLKRSHNAAEPAWSHAVQLGGFFRPGTSAIGGKPGTGGREGVRQPFPPPIHLATTDFSGLDGSPASSAPAAAGGSSTGAAASTGAESSASTPSAPTLASGELILLAAPSLHFFDGRTANRSWAQEIPQPVSKAVWGSHAEIHPQTAAKLGVVTGTLLILKSPHGRLEVPALLSPGIHPEAIAVEIGQGHTHFGRSASGIGVNVLTLTDRSFDAASGGPAWSGVKVSVEPAAVMRAPVVLQTSSDQNETRLARGMTITDLTKAPEKRIKSEYTPLHIQEHRPSLYSADVPKLHPQSNRKWGMVIDLDRCVGCNACVAACYEENNVPVVGKEECARGREMAWLRIETYAGDVPIAADPDPAVTELDPRFLPMVCQQCDNAPCEYVCPVNATEHNDEGLNMQVYNRCVGTRFCSNNCPYKVRRFNWFSHVFPAPLDQQLNPDVIKRGKGVMEKCTFCIQRIRRTEIDAGAEGHRAIADGEIQTACMQTCPADAIIFGDQRDGASVVRQRFERGKRGYGALEDLNTYPNVVYLERVRAEKV